MAKREKNHITYFDKICKFILIAAYTGKLSFKICFKFILIVAYTGKLSFKICFIESDYVKDTDRENAQKQFNTIILKKEPSLLLIIVGKKISSVNFVLIDVYTRN